MKLSLSTHEPPEHAVLRAWSAVIARGDVSSPENVFLSVDADARLSASAVRDVMRELRAKGTVPNGG